MLKIRLQRHGRNKYPFYHIVAADSRAPRDGKFVELLGRYNPNTNPATIELDIDKTVQHLMSGAQPTETTRAILSYTGALYRHHLLKGVAKGVITLEQADERYKTWKTEKETRIQDKRNRLTSSKEDAHKHRLAAESIVKEQRAAAIELKRKPHIENLIQEDSSPVTEDSTPEEGAAE